MKDIYLFIHYIISNYPSIILYDLYSYLDSEIGKSSIISRDFYDIRITLDSKLDINK